MVQKIINDPVYGFISIDHPLILEIISHPYYQRLRNIHQMAFAHLVYPGAVHTRLHHSLGAYHLMCIALDELKRKGVEITDEEALGAKIAILLHDVGHGPFSHALEEVVVEGVHHEKMSLLIMQKLNQQLNNRLDTAISIFTAQYPKQFLHQLISGQLDVDRMDYLNRDSFFSGVAEGVIGYDRILKMLTVHNGNLVVEEKGIFSIEKFLVSRRLMYWQVYLHKTVVGAEMMLVKILHRVKQLIKNGTEVKAATYALDYFLHKKAGTTNIEPDLDKFCSLDDTDIVASIKNWQQHTDKILSTLCTCLIQRKLYKVRFQAQPLAIEEWENLVNMVMDKWQVGRDEAGYYLFEGVASNTAYNVNDDRINILYKNGTLKDILNVDNALIQHNLISPVKKYYICMLR